MREFKVQPRILARDFFFTGSKGFWECLVRARADDYIGGSGQIIDFSADGGQNWIRVANFSPADTNNVNIAYDGVDTYVITCGTTGAGNDGIFTSTDSGASFTRTTGITGINWATDTFRGIEYGLSKLWGNLADGGTGVGVLRSSTDDGDTWSAIEYQDTFENIIFAINGAGIMAGAVDSSSPRGTFDADGVSIPTQTADFFGVGATFSFFASANDALWAEGGSTFPNRFWATFVSNVNVVQMLYSDDNGVTWDRAQLAQVSSTIPAFSVSSDMRMFWDGTNYHLILFGTQDLWLWSKDGTFWTFAPHGHDMAEFSSGFNTNLDRYGQWNQP